MPNAHEDGKKLTTFWLSPEEKEALREAARIEGVNMTEMLRRSIDRYLKEHRSTNEQNKKEGSDHDN